MNEYQLYAIAGIAFVGIVADRIIEYNNKRKLTSILENIKNHVLHAEALSLKIENNSDKIIRCLDNLSE